MSNSKVVRKFERFLFNGVPEQPEPTWERDDNTHVYMRQTGKPQTSSHNFDLNESCLVIGHFKYDFENNTEKYYPHPIDWDKEEK